MTAIAYRLFAALLLFGGLSMFQPARAAQSYDACTGFIDSVPTTISTQGVWCLRSHLSTNITSGNAITIATNNVTIDCNDFRIGGLAAGNGSSAIGIRAESRQNATVRNCNVRGFLYGIYLNLGAGHLVEDNRLDNNLYTGIYVSGDNNRVRRNAVYDTGGRVGFNSSFGISASADIVENTVSGLFANSPDGALEGITALGSGAQVRDNTVSGFAMTASQGGFVSMANGIVVLEMRQRISGNQVVGGIGVNINGIGIRSFFTAHCLQNTVAGFATNFQNSCTGTGNWTPP